MKKKLDNRDRIILDNYGPRDTCFLFFGQNFTSSQGQDLETQIRKPNTPQTQTQIS